MLLTCSLADVTLVYHSGPSPATTGVLRLEPSEAARRAAPRSTQLGGQRVHMLNMQYRMHP